MKAQFCQRWLRMWYLARLSVRQHRRPTSQAFQPSDQVCFTFPTQQRFREEKPTRSGADSIRSHIPVVAAQSYLTLSLRMTTTLRIKHMLQLYS